jgi:hypothetical protein
VLWPLEVGRLNLRLKVGAKQSGGSVRVGGWGVGVYGSAEEGVHLWHGCVWCVRACVGEALCAGRLGVSAGRECVECVCESKCVCVLCVRERRKRRKRAEQIETAMHVRVCMCGYDAERMRVCEAS